MSADAEILDRAADLIARNGWWQGFYYDLGTDLPRRECALCTRGAINLAANGRAPDRLSDAAEDALRALERHLDISGEYPHSVADWNDNPERTVEQVVAALRGAAAAERVAAAGPETAGADR